MKLQYEIYSIKRELTSACFIFPPVQIIYKIKKHNNPDITENTDYICDRVFEVMDKNKDSK